MRYSKAILTTWFLGLCILFLGTTTVYAQTPGIPYQAYIIDEDSGSIPGDDIDVPLANQEVLLRFEIRDSQGRVEYTEEILVKTDEFGLANTVVGVGNGTATYGNFSTINWDGNQKRMHIDIDFSKSGNSYEDHGYLDLTYIPGPNSGGSGGGQETITTLVYNNDGSFTYTSEDGTKTTFSVPQHAAGNPNTLGTAGHMGDIFVDETTGNLFVHGGSSWQPISSAQETITALVKNSGTVTYTSENGTQTSFEVTQTGAGDPNTNGATANTGGVYVDENTGELYIYLGTAWLKQTAAMRASNGLMVQNNEVQLGGALTQPTTLTTSATNTLAIDGLQTADTSTGNFEQVVIDKTTGVLHKAEISSKGNQKIAKITANLGDSQFSTPLTILELDNIDVYRNGVRVDFVQVNANTIALDGISCYSGDEIRIVQLQ